MSTLAVSHLSKAFGGVRAVRDLSFAVESGELLAMIGPNGAGKSTCFNLVNGQLKPDAGEIFFEDRRIDGLPPYELCRRGVGRSFQVAATFGSMSVRENVQVAMLATQRKLHSLVSSLGNSNAAQEMLDRVGMGEQANRPCADLAYGDLKRVELAMALASSPRVLLMDEPAAGMAAGERQALMGLVRQISRETGISVLFTEHDMDVVFAYADRVIVLSEGELIANGSPETVRADALVRRIYLGEETPSA